MNGLEKVIYFFCIFVFIFERRDNGIYVIGLMWRRKVVVFLWLAFGNRSYELLIVMNVYEGFL